MNISKIPLLSVKNKKLRLQYAQAQHITTSKKNKGMQKSISAFKTNENLKKSYSSRRLHSRPPCTTSFMRAWVLAVIILTKKDK